MMADDAKTMLAQRQQLAEMRQEASKLSDFAHNGRGKGRDDIIADIDRIDADLAARLAAFVVQPDGETVH